jgi:hypothetical protein
MGKTTVTARYGFWYENEKGNLDSGPGALTSGSTHESNSDHTVQLSSTTIFTDKFINESQFQFERHDENHYPDSTERTVSVAGDFVGGFTGQTSQNHKVAVEFQNLSTLSHGIHAIKFGTRIRNNREPIRATQISTACSIFLPPPLDKPRTPLARCMSNLPMAWPAARASIAWYKGDLALRRQVTPPAIRRRWPMFSTLLCLRRMMRG